MLLNKVLPLKNRLLEDEVFRGSIISLFIKVLASVIAFAVNVFAARMLGIAEFGLYSIALSIMAIGVVFGKFGFEQTSLKYLSKTIVDNNVVEESKVLSFCLFITLLASSFIALVLFVLSPAIAEHVFSKPSLSSVLVIASLTIIPMVLLNITSQVFRAHKNMMAFTMFSGGGNRKYHVNFNCHFSA